MAYSIKERIEKIKPYFVSFNVIAEDDASYLLVRLPGTWTIPDQNAIKENYKVEIVAKQEGIYFFTELKNSTDCLFDAADYIILFNKSVEERKALLNEKIRQLTEIFATEPLEYLKQIKFSLPETVEKKKQAKKGEKGSKAAKATVKKVEEPKAVETLLETEKNIKKASDKLEDNDLMSFAKTLTSS